MLRNTAILFLTCLISIASRASEHDSLVWNIYAPVEHSTEYNVHHVKTYFFDANPVATQTQDVDKLKKQHDSLAQIAIGKVFMREMPDQTGLGTNTWYWWAVREQGKTYLKCYVSGVNSTGTAKHSYYEVTFKDGSKSKWNAPEGSPYNYNHMFVLLNGNMQTVDATTKDVTTVHADETLYKNALQQPIHYITKYDGFAKEGKIEYYPTMQYVFNTKESKQLLNTIKQLDKQSQPIVAIK